MEETITEVHLCTVDLAERVLPALQKIGASALGFALVSGSGERNGRGGCIGVVVGAVKLQVYRYSWRI